ncbi:unnamed protein product [Penicillium roqueforti FM164]|uniref:Genomic scaffold, ProqFM164S04 n=1 Tax=Penicillium roqueforti (strain FM164) TaxID=1365484 RepID=W6QMD5_PENRF|nr:unnamed protein product [Penicillium roqueforti FM164]
MGHVVSSRLFLHNFFFLFSSSSSSPLSFLLLSNAIFEAYHHYCEFLLALWFSTSGFWSSLNVDCA